MKALRELLLNRHQAMEPKLDTLRQEIVETMFLTAATGTRKAEPFFSLAAWFVTAWSEVVLRPKRIWIGMAASWVAILCINLATSDPLPASQTCSVTSAPKSKAIYLEQQRIYAELMRSLSAESFDNVGPVQVVPSPRSECPTHRFQA